MRGRLLIIFLISIVACETDVLEFEAETNIFAVFKVKDFGLGRGWMEVFVDQSHSIDDSLSGYSFSNRFYYVEGISGAKVTIYSGIDSISFEEGYPSGHYENRMETDENTLYKLEVLLPWGDTVIGSAYMPEPVEFFWPLEEWDSITHIISIDTVSISKELENPSMVLWNSCKNVSKYFIYCEPIFSVNNIAIPSVTSDTCYPFFVERAVWPWTFNMNHDLTVVGITHEYEEYANQQSPGKANLSSGYGVFTGITIDRVPVHIVE